MNSFFVSLGNNVIDHSISTTLLFLNTSNDKGDGENRKWIEPFGKYTRIQYRILTFQEPLTGLLNFVMWKSKNFMMMFISCLVAAGQHENWKIVLLFLGRLSCCLFSKRWLFSNLRAFTWYRFHTERRQTFQNEGVAREGGGGGGWPELKAALHRPLNKVSSHLGWRNRQGGGASKISPPAPPRPCFHNFNLKRNIAFACEFLLKEYLGIDIEH